MKKDKIFGAPKQKVALADTKMSINGCQLLMGHPDPSHAQATADQFKGQLESVIGRATMNDFYSANRAIYRQLISGESLIN